jgi:glyoxylase-like metal-dependent hydrolase (beta-lactamase superfamily II)
LAGERPLHRRGGAGSPGHLRRDEYGVHERCERSAGQRRRRNGRSARNLRDACLDLSEIELDVHHYWISAGGAASSSIGSGVIIETFAVGPLACNCTILADEASGEAIVVDGGDGVDEVLRRLRSRNLRATHLLHTHAHIDHIGDLDALRARAGGRAMLHPADLPLYRALELQASWIGLAQAPRVVDLDADLRDGDVIRLGDTRIEVLHTPGHTPGSVCFAIQENAKTSILSGDTLFAGSIGRWDLGGTSMEDIVASIHRKLMDYADETRVVPGHGPFTTIGMERNSNPYLQ